jgi:hypothetical protein
MATDEDLMIMQVGLAKIVQKDAIDGEDVIRLTDYLMRILDSKRYWVEVLKHSKSESDTIYANSKIEKISRVQERIIEIIEKKPKPSPMIEYYEESIRLAINELKKLEEGYKSYTVKLLIG